MQKRKMFQSPLALILMIPLGAIIIFFICDYVSGLINDYKFQDASKTVLSSILQNRDMTDMEERKAYALKKYKELGYTDNNLTLVEKNGELILINYYTFNTMRSELLKRDKGLSVASYKGHYNEYQEVVIEKYDEEIIIE